LAKETNMPFAKVSTDYENISARTEGTAFTDEEPEQLGLIGQQPDGVEDIGTRPSCTKS
jgi:hypothetical protein